MIQLSSAGKHFGSKTLFEGLNWVVNNGERVKQEFDKSGTAT